MPVNNDTTKPKLSNNNLMIVMVLISLLVVGVSALVGKALVSSILRDTKVISAKSKADKQAKEDVTSAPKLVDAYNVLGSVANTLNDALPDSKDMPGLLVTLENMSNDSGLGLKSITPAVLAIAASAPISDQNGQSSAATSSSAASSGSTVATPNPFNLVIDYDGSYPALAKFLGDIEQSVRPMKVTSVTMNGNGSALTGEIDLTTYWQSPAQLPFSTETIK